MLIEHEHAFQSIEDISTFQLVDHRARNPVSLRFDFVINVKAKNEFVSLSLPQMSYSMKSAYCLSDSQSYAGAQTNSAQRVGWA